MAERAGTVPLSTPLSLCISYDEEIGCVGIRQMMPELNQLIGKPRLVIVGEPTSMQVATGPQGKDNPESNVSWTGRTQCACA